MSAQVTFALPSGRMLDDCLHALARAGFECDIAEGTRKLMFESGPARYILARPGDVPVYVSHGAADFGIVGKDVLDEDCPDVYELLDLGFGAARFALAAPEPVAAELYRRVSEKRAGLCSPPSRPLRVATKFPRVAYTYFRGIGIPAEIITLRGALELAPQAGLADAIIDIVSTGRTLRENGLSEIESISATTARLIANRASMGLWPEGARAVVSAFETNQDGSVGE
ncbi:MAG: ATP phosphoribosyltransferase [Clostridia bacterium]|nr:ATP phosphoribosyltransferase [Clostridia bacterium]